MKTKRIITIIGALTIALAISFTACKKNEDGPGDDLKVGNDNAKIQADFDDAISIIDGAFSQTSKAMRLSGPSGTESVQSFNICGATVDTSLLASQKLITVTFNGSTTCNGRIRSGVITAKLVTGTRWKDTDAVLLLTFTNYRVNYVSTNVAFTYNGTKTIKNLTGGLIRTLGNGGPQTVTHKVRGNMTITFDDNTERNWWITRLNTYDYNGGDTRLISAGDTLIDSIPAATGGTNRLGYPFINQAPTPIVALQTCGFYKPVDGVRIHKYNNRVVTVTFGVNQLGNPAGGSCAYGYKVQWIRLNGETGTAILQYPQ